MPKRIAASEYRSMNESRKAPNLVSSPNFLANAPSNASNAPDMITRHRHIRCVRERSLCRQRLRRESRLSRGHLGSLSCTPESGRTDLRVFLPDSLPDLSYQVHQTIAWKPSFLLLLIADEDIMRSQRKGWLMEIVGTHS